MKITDTDFLKRMIVTRPGDLPGMFARRLVEGLSKAPTGIASTQFGDVRYDVDMSLHALAKKYYFHTHEPFLEAVFRQFLKPGDTFIDIGANMGYWSAFAASLIGRGGELHAFEPVPRFFASVEKLAKNNPAYRIHANNAALGAEPGVLPMEVVEPSAANFNNFEINIGSSSLLPGFLNEHKALTKTINVDVTTLDSYVASRPVDIERVGLIKIDVEGFEPFCFEGMKALMSKPGRKVPILCELLTDPSRGVKGADMVRLIQSHGYTCLDALTMKPIAIDSMHFEENVVCI